MTVFTKYPAVRLLLLTLAGLLAGLFIELSFEILMIILISAVLVSIAGILSKRYSLIYYLCVPVIGLWLSFQVDNVNIKAPEKYIPDMKGIAQGKVIKIFTKRDNYYRCLLQGNVDTRPLPLIRNNRIILSIYSKGEESLDIQPGSEIYAKGKFRLPRSPQLPEEFPEQQYASSLGVQWIASASMKDIAINSQPSGFHHWQNNIAGSVRERIDTLFPDSTAGIVKAITTGDKTDIPQEQKQNFSFAGTAHVLAVSGLHVGIIAAVFYFALAFVKNRWIKFVLFTLLITSFVIFTGMPPSAVRAGFMAAAYLLVYTVQRKGEPLNIFALVLFLIIIFSPEMIYSAGFHMSAGAILGITLFYKPIRNFFKKLFIINNILYDMIIGSISITFAVSLIVSPIVAYYFNVFSIISPISNLLVIPAMSLSLIYTLLSLFFSIFSPWLASIFALAADTFISAAIWVNSIAVEIPNAYITGKDSILYSVIFLIPLFYVFFSDNIRQTIFRAAAGISAAVLVFLFVDDNSTERNIRIYPRPQYVAAFIPLDDTTTFAYLADRKPAQYPFRDYHMEQHFINSQDSLIIGVTGNAGQNIYDYVSKERPTKCIEISHKIQEKIEKSLNLKYELPQIIEMDINEREFQHPRAGDL